MAHEIAHFVLHRKINLSILNNEVEIKDTSRDLLLEQLESDNPRTWLEWQANKFASSLLLPRLTIPIAISEKQSEIGVIKNIGKIFLDRGTGSYNDYLEIMEHLSLLYQTSKSAIRIRLRELNILYEGSGSPIEPSDGPAPLNYFLSTIVNNVLDENG